MGVLGHKGGGPGVWQSTEKGSSGCCMGERRMSCYHSEW